MGNRKNSKLIKFITATAFLTMVVVNGLANGLPINGMNTGQVSDAYPNLFAPAGYTFSIWGLIYLLLAFYTLYQIGLFNGNSFVVKKELLHKIGLIFSLSCVANAGWIFSWHYQMIPLSMVLMLVILLCLILINNLIKQERLIGREKFFIRLPFSIYYGWITVATIANVTVLLVSIGWKGFGIPEAYWTVAIILTGMAIGLARMLTNRDIAYGLVLIWAYGGILYKHMSASGFAGEYFSIMTSVIVAMVLFVVGIANLLFVKRRPIMYN